ncbi:MAG: acylphosphatase [Candidatus Omnitrophica bacterium]|nr:acylphosphatase [Candidatus Omnitrophota bacterium]
MEKAEHKTLHAFFSGVVQGVGFRFTSRDLARRYKLRGWVRNLADGRVELLAQGHEPNLEHFFKDLQQEFRSHIAKSIVDYADSSDTFKGFEIRF